MSCIYIIEFANEVIHLGNEAVPSLLTNKYKLKHVGSNPALVNLAEIQTVGVQCTRSKYQGKHCNIHTQRE